VRNGTDESEGDVNGNVENSSAFEGADRSWIMQNLWSLPFRFFAYSSPQCSNVPTIPTLVLPATSDSAISHNHVGGGKKLMPAHFKYTAMTPRVVKGPPLDFAQLSPRDSEFGLDDWQLRMEALLDAKHLEGVAMTPRVGTDSAWPPAEIPPPSPRDSEFGLGEWQLDMEAMLDSAHLNPPIHQIPRRSCSVTPDSEVTLEEKDPQHGPDDMAQKVEQLQAQVHFWKQRAEKLADGYDDEPLNISAAPHDDQPRQTANPMVQDQV
jgi:hypothetical protein